MQNVEGRVAVVTGAASGVGFALARQLLESSMKVVISDVEAPALEDAQSRLQQYGEVEAVVCDVSAEESVVALAEATLKRFGAVHLVCNNAGVESGGRIEDVTPSQWEWVMGVNIGGMLNGVRAFLPIMKAQNEGHIVSTASLAGLAGAVPAAAPYGVSKSAVITLTETLDAELRAEDFNISASVILLGNVRDTQMGNAGRNRPEHVPAPTDSELRQQALRATQERMKAALTPEQVAQRILRGIQEDNLHIITHPETTKKIVAARYDKLLQALEISGSNDG